MLFKRNRKLPNGQTRTYPNWWYQFQREGLFVRVNTKQGDRKVAVELESAHRTRLAKGEAGLHDPRAVPTLKQFEKRFIDAIKTRRADKPRKSCPVTATTCSVPILQSGSPA